MVPEQEEEGLLHFKDQQSARHRRSRGCSQLYPGLRQLQYCLVLHGKNLKIQVLCQPSQVELVRKDHKNSSFSITASMSWLYLILM